MVKDCSGGISAQTTPAPLSERSTTRQSIAVSSAGTIILPASDVAMRSERRSSNSAFFLTAKRISPSIRVACAGGADAAEEIAEDRAQLLNVPRARRAGREAIAPEARDMGHRAHLLAHLQEQRRRFEQEGAERHRVFVLDEPRIGGVVDRKHAADLVEVALDRDDDGALGAA